MNISSSRFFTVRDKALYKSINNRFEAIYKDVMQSQPHLLNGSRDTVIQWSREVEYPWAVVNSNIKEGMRVVDLGCGGSPLPYYLYHDMKCSQVYGVDKVLFPNERNSLWGYVENPCYRFPEINWLQKDIRFVELFDIDRVFCISVFEHMSIEDRHIALSNISRILSNDGLFIMTMDVDVLHPTTFVIDFMNAAKKYGLYVRGDRNFNVPSDDTKLGVCYVCGVVLSKIEY